MTVAIRDRKQADGLVIMSKAGYMQWLKQNANVTVGFVGYQSRMTPVMNYAKSLGFEFGNQRMPQWASKLSEAYQNAMLAGIVRGSQAIDEVLSTLGYSVYIQFYAVEED